MPQTPGSADRAPTTPSPAAVRTARAGLRVAAAGLASALLLAAVPAAAQVAVPPSASGAAAAAPEGAAMTPTRMPRPGSSMSLEREGTGHARKTAEQRFEDANTTHDGHLTEAQAQAAHMRGVASHFAEIDGHHRGYVTLDEIRSWRAERRAERKAAREKAAK